MISLMPLGKLAHPPRMLSVRPELFLPCLPPWRGPIFFMGQFSVMNHAGVVHQPATAALRNLPS
jgi:hypothetical protein